MSQTPAGVSEFDAIVVGAGPAGSSTATQSAPLVVAADGNSSRISLKMGIIKRDDRPMGVAVRTCYTSPRHNDDHLESAEYAADAMAEAHYRGVGTTGAEKALRAYPTRLRAELGGYYRLGGISVKLIGHPEVMKICTKYGLPRKTLMKFTLKLLANLTDSFEGDAMDKVINSLSKVAPSA